MGIFTEHEGRHVADITIYALSTCPYCNATKAFLNENDIEYQYVDVDTAPPSVAVEIEQQVAQYNPDETFPTIVIDNGLEVIVGFQKDKLEQLIKEKACPARPKMNTEFQRSNP